MDYQVMECRYNYKPDDADLLFATNDRQEAAEAARKFGSGTVVVKVDEKEMRKEYIPRLTKQIWYSKSRSSPQQAISKKIVTFYLLDISKGFQPYRNLILLQTGLEVYCVLNRKRREFGRSSNR